MSVQKETEKFHMRCGEVLRMALHVESSLEFFISNYFCYPQSYKTFMFHDLMLVKNNFDRKIQIFREICKREHISGYEEIIKSVDFIKNIRNKVAHYEAVVDDPKEGIVSLWSKKSIRYKKDTIELTDALLKEIDEKRLSAIQGITKIHVDLSKTNMSNPEVPDVVI